MAADQPPPKAPSPEMLRAAREYAFTTALLVMRLEQSALVAVGFATRAQFLDVAGEAYDSAARLLEENRISYLEKLSSGGRPAPGSRDFRPGKVDPDEI